MVFLKKNWYDKLEAESDWLVDEPAELRAAIQIELLANLLPFWRERSVDSAHGGIHWRVDRRRCRARR